MSSGGHGSALDRLAAELEEPVARLGIQGLSTTRLEVLLSRAECRAWRVESIEDPGVITACCPLGSGRTTLACARPPLAEPASGAFLVARSLPVGPGRWVLLGRPAVVSRSEAGKFELLLRSLRAPRGEFWRVHGGVLVQAARAA